MGGTSLTVKMRATMGRAAPGLGPRIFGGETVSKSWKHCRLIFTFLQGILYGFTKISVGRVHESPNFFSIQR